MPRKSPSQVIEHRISLSDFERREIKQTLDAMQLRSNLDSAGRFVVGAAAVAVVGTAAFAALDIYKYVKDIPETVYDAVSGAGASLKQNVAKHEGNVIAGTANWVFDGISGLFGDDES
tara:strand:+ start:178 stop:531 length:354 start_codon:yes stop_codon:yes gene_type:complete